MKHFIIRKLSFLAAASACMLSCIPILMLFAGAVTGKQEWMECMRGIFEGQGETYFFLFPSYPTLRGFIEVLFDKPEFYVVFWNSVKLTCLITAGQIFFAVPAAWGFSRLHGRLSGLLFYLYIILMLLPFQVTMLSNYMVLDGMGILDTHAAVILPAVFSTFPVFLIYHSFVEIPEDVLEAFSLESGSRLKMFWHIGIPLAMPGIKAAVLLSVIEYWNMIEQPLLFLKTPSLWPFSIYMPGITCENVRYIVVCSLIVLIPMILIVFWGRDDMKKGIGAMVLKG